ncbi:MAG: hypothetical protein KA715_04705 [Xanthomonadaceae bacterium]|nr:hypothetical protein [Xanthomonadaceae bacterium]
MLSKLSLWSLMSVAALSVGCGILGQNKAFDKNIFFKSNSAGCLNQFGNQFETYLVGDVSANEWETTWNCVDSTLTQFQSFARGSDIEGFTVSDIKMLLENFLLTNKTVSDSFVESNLELKAALIGGNPNLLSYKEVNRLRDLLALVKKETTTLIPFMKARKLGNSKADLVRLSQAVEASGKRMSTFFEGKPLHTLQKAKMKALLDGLRTTFGWNIPVELVDALFAAKETIISGSGESIEGSAWSKVFQIAGTGAGSLLALKAYTPDSKMELITDLIRAHENMTFQVLAWQGGSLKHEKINNIIDQLPEEWKKIDGEILKKTIKNVSSRILFSTTTDGFDLGSFQTMFLFLDDWMRADGHSEAIFKLFPPYTTTVTQNEFNLKALVYLNKMDSILDQNSVRKVIEVSQKYRPLFEPGESEIRFQTGVQLSLNHMKKMVLFNLLSNHMMKCYALSKNKAINPNGVTADNFKEIFDDFGPIAGQLNLIDVTFPNLYLKRFREADLFTFASNGNQFVDVDEATNYLAVIASSFTLSRKIKSDTENECALSDGSKDKLEWNWMDINCFRGKISDGLETYLRMFPMLKNYFNRLSISDQRKLFNNMEKGYRLSGNSEVPIASYDVQAMTGYLHYIEAIFLKFDDDQSQTFNKKELLKMFPNFKKLLAVAAKQEESNTGMLEAIFTYVVKFGHSPEESIWRKIHFFAWMIGRPFWKINADRGDIYAIVPVLMGSPPTGSEKSSLLSDDQLAEIQNMTPQQRAAIDPNMFN